MIAALDQGSTGMLDLLLGFGHVTMASADGRDPMATSATGFGALLAALQSDSPLSELSAARPIFGASTPFLDPEEIETGDPIESEDVADLAIEVAAVPIAVENQTASSAMATTWKVRADRPSAPTTFHPEELDEPTESEPGKWRLGATQSWSSEPSSVPRAQQPEMALDADAPVSGPTSAFAIDARLQGAIGTPMMRAMHATPTMPTILGSAGPDGGSAEHREADSRTLADAASQAWMRGITDAGAQRQPLPPSGGLSDVAERTSAPAPTVPSAQGTPLNTAEVAEQLLDAEAEHSGTAGVDARATNPVREHIVRLVRTIDPAQVHVLRGEDRRREMAGALRLSASDLGRRLASDPAAAARAPITSGSERADLDPRMHPAPVQGDMRQVVEAVEADAPDQQATQHASPMEPASGALADQRGRENPKAGTRPDASAPVLDGTTTVVRSEPQALPASATLDLGARLRLAIAQTIVDAGREQLLESVRGRFEAQVTVQPAHLGTVHVQVTRTDVQGGLNVLLVAAHQDAARALEEGIDELVDELVRHRIEVAEVNVRRGGGPAHDAPRDGQQRSAAQDQDERERREDAAARQRADERDPERRHTPFARWGLDDLDEPHAAQTPLGGRYIR